MCTGGASLFALIISIFWPVFRSVYLLYKASRGPSSIQVLIGALDDVNELSSSVAMSHLSSFGQQAVPYLCAAVEDRNQHHTKRSRAAECLRRIAIMKKGAACADMMTTLRVGSIDENDDLRVKCLWALWRCEKRATDVVPGLTALLCSNDEHVVYEAICALQEIGPGAGASVNALLELSRNEPLFANNVSDAIRAIRPEPSKDELKDRNP